MLILMSLSSSGYTSSLSWRGSRASIPGAALSFITPFQFRHYYLSFPCCSFCSVGHSLFWLSIFCKISWGRQGWQHSYKLCCLGTHWTTDSWWPITGRLWKMWGDTSLTMMYTLWFMSWLEELAIKLVHYTILVVNMSW